MFARPLLLICFLCAGAAHPLMATEEAETIYDEDSSFFTKRVWVVINPSYAPFFQKGTEVYLSSKETLFSQETPPTKMKSYKKGGTQPFYYFDLPVQSECFRVLSIRTEDNATIAASHWITEIQPSRLYEVGDFPRTIRYRPADTYTQAAVSAYVLAMVLSSYQSYDSAYENGYSAFPELNTYWVKWVPAASLQSVYLYEYTREQCQSKDPEAKKEVKISVSEKLAEMEREYTAGPKTNPLTQKRNILIESLVLVGCFLISIFLLLAIRKVVVLSNKRRSPSESRR